MMHSYEALMMHSYKFALTLLLTLALGLVAWIVETLVDRFRPNMGLVGRFFIMLVLVLAIGLVAIGMARAHDEGQWGKSDPAVRDWYQGLMQPDNPGVSCCGEADAYWADEIHIRNGKTYVTITDPRDDAPLHRPHVENGTEIEIPDHKLKWDRGNPTGHGVLFLSRGGYVFCYVQPGGV